MTNTNQFTVVPKASLFGKEKEFDGFMPAKEKDFESIIINDYKPVSNPDSVGSPYLNSCKQIVTCCYIVNPESELISLYRSSRLRNNGNNPGPDSLPSGMWSCLYTNHLPSIKEAIDNPFVTGNPIHATMLTQLSNSVFVDEGVIDSNPHLLGYVNFLSNEATQAHFGLIYVLSTNAHIVGKKDADINKMVSLNTVDNLVCRGPAYNQHLSWSFWGDKSYAPLKKHLIDLFGDRSFE